MNKKEIKEEYEDELKDMGINIDKMTLPDDFVRSLCNLKRQIKYLDNKVFDLDSDFRYLEDCTVGDLKHQIGRLDDVVDDLNR